MRQTGNYYYGARYYNPKFSIWLSVDPLAEKYPSHSPYNYTLNNPINFVDPDGRSVDEPKDWIPKVSDDGTIKYIKEENDTAETLDAQFSNINADQAKTLFSKLRQESKIDGTCDWFISGDDVADVLGTKILKYDIGSKQANSQRFFDQYLFARDYSSESNAFDSSNFFERNYSLKAEGDAFITVDNRTFKIHYRIPLSLGATSNERGVGLGSTPFYINNSGKQRWFKHGHGLRFGLIHPKTGNDWGSYYSIYTSNKNSNILVNRLSKKIHVQKTFIKSNNLPIIKN